MISVREVIVVEGRYDRIKLSSFISSPVIETGGFRIFKDKEKQSLIRKLAKERGILVLTDSDSGGLVIRNFLQGAVPPPMIKHAYVPQLKGKEKRKEAPSKDGILGVEGLNEDIILKAIRSSGATIEGESCEKKGKITKSDLYELGLTGRDNSKILREKLLRSLDMPTYLSTNAMLTALNSLYSFEELKVLINTL